MANFYTSNKKALQTGLPGGNNFVKDAGGGRCRKDFQHSILFLIKGEGLSDVYRRIS
jgi:hypothetical protein